MAKNQSTQTSSSEPWAPSQAALKTGLTDAQNLYAGGIGGQVDTTSHVIPFAQQSMDAFRGVEGNARSNMGGQGLSGQYQGIINSGGFNAPQMEALGGIRSTANSSFNPYDNEGFGSVLRQSQDAARNNVNAGASAAGRYGSGVHQGSVAREVGNVTGGLLNNEYNNWQNRRTGAQTQLFNAGQQGQSNLSNAWEGMQQPYDALTRVGGQFEDLATRQMNDRTRVFDAQQNAPWNQLGRLNAVASGAGSLGGTSSGTATQPGGSVIGQGIGGLLALSGLFG